MLKQRWLQGCNQTLDQRRWRNVGPVFHIVTGPTSSANRLPIDYMILAQRRSNSCLLAGEGLHNNPKKIKLVKVKSCCRFTVEEWERVVPVLFKSGLIQQQQLGLGGRAVPCNISCWLITSEQFTHLSQQLDVLCFTLTPVYQYIIRNQQ